LTFALQAGAPAAEEAWAARCRHAGISSAMALSHATPTANPGTWRNAATAPLRQRQRECDQALTGTARHWLQRLPARRRPYRLCADHPRVANRLAWVWPDAATSALVLDDLLQDRRGGRRGFAPSIVRELRRLRDFNAAQRVERAPEGWWEILGRVTRAW